VKRIQTEYTGTEQSIKKDVTIIMRVSFNTVRFIWLPRSLIIAFITFLSMFSLDAFTGNAPFIEELVGFFIHMLPSFIMILLLVLSWNRPVAAGYIFTTLGIVFTFFFNTYEQIEKLLTISLIPVAVGLLFLVPSFIRKRRAA
jgi:hypothetical protein